MKSLLRNMEVRNLYKIFFFIIFLSVFVSLVSADCQGGQIDINSASLKKLDEIIWVGPATAQKIIEARPYENLSDIKKVKGIGDSKLEAIKEQGLACVGDGDVSKKVGKSGERDVKNSGISMENAKAPKIIGTAEKNIVLNSKDKPILLNGAMENSKNVAGNSDNIVYKSKNSKILEFLPYAFSVFLILIIVILFWERF